MWTLRSQHYLTPESEKPHSTWEVCYYMYLERCFWKHILAKSRSLRQCGYQCWKVAPNNAEWKALVNCTMHGRKALYFAPFFKPHSPKCRDLTLCVKANRSTCTGVYSDSDADYWKRSYIVSAEWLRLWRYERGIRQSRMYLISVGYM